MHMHSHSAEGPLFFRTQILSRGPASTFHTFSIKKKRYLELSIIIILYRRFRGFFSPTDTPSVSFFFKAIEHLFGND